MGGSEGKWLALSEVEVSDMSESFMLVWWDVSLDEWLGCDEVEGFVCEEWDELDVDGKHISKSS
jgi:hypothetical protein